jgi:phage head maturation protease/phage shock protein A
MRFFSEIQKIEPLQDGTVKAYGYASAPVRDSHGEIVTAAAMSKAIDEYMRFPAVRAMHRSDNAAGRCLEISLDDNERTAFVAHIVDDDAVKKVKAGVYRGFSIGGRIKKRNPQDPSIIQEIDLREVSLVDRPSCPEATLDLWKRDDMDPLDGAHRELLNGARQDEPLNRAAMPTTAPASDFEDKGQWNDGFDIKPEGPSSVSSGGPYPTSAPDRGADAGNTSMPTNPNEGKATVQSPPANATQDTGGNSGAGAGGGQRDYFSPFPGATNKGEEGTPLQNLFRMISEMYEASQKPPVDLATTITKRVFTVDERRAAAKSGAAMRDGSYPILNKADLAIALESKNLTPAAKAHLITRARTLDAIAMIPPDWLSNEAKADLKPQDSVATRVSKTDTLLRNTLETLERLEVRTKRGKATPEAYRLAKAYLGMDVDALAEVLAADALNKIADNDRKVADADALAKKFRDENELLMKQIDETNKGLEIFAARLAKLEAQPMPTKTAGSIYAGDHGGQTQFTPDAIAKAKATFEDMTDEQRALLLTKVALQHPRHMNLAPMPSPPRSPGGGTAGLQE